ncbi:MAG: hypothetical protein JW864_04460 [Spirochaetes bacterium]|nr:hypothetical protein [Spirochaetota bacterium]
MKSPQKEKKDNIKTEDDTLYGLLSMYKIYNTYFRILINPDNDHIALQITDNPGKWPIIGEGQYKGYKLLKRSEVGLIKLSVKYLSPEHLISQLGPLLGAKLSDDDITILNYLDSEGYYSIEANSSFLQEFINLINKIIEFTPKKKYEIIEKSLSEDL